MCKGLFLLVVLVCSVAAFGQQTTEGSLYAVGKTGNQMGACPLKSTAVKADISGFISRVRVRQEFENNFTEPIEAIYVFPLSQNGAVDEMTMTVGERTIRGKIMRREEARQTYETAKSEGKTASLLDQERPNIFTQSVANIMPGERVIVEIAYVETLKYEDGAYEFVFPMVVGPRYIPSSVNDAAKIKPPVAETRAGHDISIEVNLNAGVPVEEIRSSSHVIDQVNFSPNTAKITLKGEKTIPNKDFILRYDVTGKRIEDAVLTHRDAKGGFFTLILQPLDKIATEDRTPKEIVFVLDTSGSMSGFPIEKAKEAMKLSLDGLYPEDTFNLITFAGDTAILFDKPVPATQANLEKAQTFLAERQGYGGTEMMKAVKAALEPSDAQDHLRIVCFMTDGYVGNENEIIAEVQKHPKARVFSFGIGSSVNRFLLDKIAQEGNGEAEYVALSDDGSKAAKKFYERVRTPLLTDLSIDWNGMPISDVYPNKLTDLFSAKPVILHGRYTKAMNGTIKLKGNIAGQPYERQITVSFPDTSTTNDALSTLWARMRIDDLSSARLKTQDAKTGGEMDAHITNIGLEFRLLTQFTSFVAVENRVVNQNGSPVTVEVPVELPEGMDRKATLGTNDTADVTSNTVGTTITSRQISSLPVNSRQASQVYSAASVVEVTSSEPMIDMTSSSMTTVFRDDGNGNFRPVTGGGGGGGYGSGRGSGSGSGSGSGNGSGDGSATIENTFVVDGSEVTSLACGVLAPPPDNKPKTVSAGVLNGKATNLAQPEYPAAAKAVKAKGAVNVQVTIDETGSVISAAAISGHPLLRASCETAAMASKFVPTSINGNAVKITGVIVYNFARSKASNIKVDNMKVGPLSPEDKKRLLLAEKLHAWLYALVDRLDKGNTKPGASETMFVHDGKADIQIELTARSAEAIEKLKQAGFEIVVDKGKTILTGKVAVEKLASLAEIEDVKLILPKI